MIFPIKFILPNNNDINIFYNLKIDDNNINKYIGIIDIKLEKNKNLLYFLFQNNEKEINLYNYKNNIVYLNQSLSSYRKWYYIELNILYYYCK
jgi:hypothetical protein